MIILMFPLAKAVSSEGNTHGSRLSVVSCVCHGHWQNADVRTYGSADFRTDSGENYGLRLRLGFV